MSVNSVLIFKSIEAKKTDPRNKPGDFKVKLIPEMNLDPNKQHFIALDHLSMSASWYNVRPEYENNKLRISKNKGVEFQEIIFPSGVYDYEDLNEFIHQRIGKLEDDENYGINIFFNISSYKVFIKLDDNYQIDFAGSGNFNELLRFKK